MNLTNYENQVLKMIDKKVSEFIAKQHAKAMRKSIVPDVLMLSNPDRKIHEKARKELRELLPLLARMTPDQFVKWGYTTQHAIILRAIQSKMWTTYIKTPRKKLHHNDAYAAIEILSQIHASADALELECMLPPPRQRERKPQPKTLVGRRAAKVDEKVEEWERKLKYARTKLKKYRSKQKYYAKKGVGV